MPTEIVFTDLDGTLLPLVLDASPEQRHRASAVATEHAVERGVAITDHVRPERRVLSLDVIISDTPIRSTPALGGSEQPTRLDLPARAARTKGPSRNGDAWQGAPLEPEAAPEIYALLFTPDSTPTRVADAWSLVLRARDHALLAVVTTHLETYEDMVLIDAGVTNTAADRTWLRAELTFAQIRRVSTELVDDPVPARARDRRQVNRGAQSTEEATAPTRPRSILSRTVEGLAGLWGGE
jgi:hypothetical protein